MPETTLTGPDLTTFLGLEALGLTTVGQLLTAERAVIVCCLPARFEARSARLAVPKGGGPAPGPRAGGVEARTAGGARAALPARAAGACGGGIRAGWLSPEPV